MKRLLYAAAALCAAGFAAPAFSQMTPVTATHLQIGGVDIASGTVILTPVDQLGNPISIVTSDGKPQFSSPSQPVGFSAAISAGAIVGPFSVPDQTLSTALTSNTPINYQVSVLNTATKQSFTYRIPYTNPVVTGSSAFALDHYAPSQAIVVSNASIVTQPTAPAHCTGAQIWYSGTSPASFGVCVGGVFVSISGTGGGSSIALLTGGVSNTLQSRLNLIGASGVTAVSDGAGNVTLTAPGIAAEASRASAAEGTNATAIGAEVTARGGADTTLQSNINALAAATEPLIPDTTFSALPTPVVGLLGHKYTVTDGTVGTACTAGGGGTARVICEVYQVSAGVYGYRAVGIPAGEKGVANGVASLDGTAKVPAANLPNIDAGTVTRNAANVTPNLGSFPLAPSLTTLVCFEGDSTTRGGIGSPATSSMDAQLALTPFGQSIAGVGGTSVHIVNMAVSGQNLSTIYARYATSCRNYKPGTVLSDGSVVGKAYFVFWSFWNDNSSGTIINSMIYTQREFAQAKADGFTVVAGVPLHDPKQSGYGTLEQNYINFIRGLSNFYDTTTPTACIAANLCGPDIVADYEALLPDLTQASMNGAGSLVYPFLASDGRHQSTLAMRIMANYLSNLLLTGFDFLPKINPFRPKGEVVMTSATTALPLDGDLITITLAGAYSPTWAAPLTPYQSKATCIQLVQPAGQSYTVTWPSNVKAGIAAPTSGNRSTGCYLWSQSQLAYVPAAGTNY